MQRFARARTLVPLTHRRPWTEHLQFEGMFTGIVMPHLDDVPLHDTELVHVINFCARPGGHALIMGGTTDKLCTQVFEKQVALTACVKETIQDRVPLSIGTKAKRTEDSLSFTTATHDIGAAANLCLSHEPRDRLARFCDRPARGSCSEALNPPRPCTRQLRRRMRRSR